MHNGEISLKNISKIEGHASLSIKIRNRKVADAKFRAIENYRFFEQMLVGRSFLQLPLVVARICGFCSYAHLSASVEAVEKAFHVEPSTQTLLLRELLCNAEFIKSHSLHLFLLVLPDYFGKESALEFDKKQMRWLKLGLSLKSVASEMTKAIGGRTYHNLTVGIGGFRQLPEQRKLEHLLHRLHEAKKDSIKAVELFSSLKSNFSFERKTNYLALVGKKYCLLCGEITSSTGVCIPEENYSSYFKEFVVPYSTAREVTFEGKEFMVGALARINLNEKEMCHDTKHLMAEHKLKFPNYSPFYNNIAQALEIVQCIDSSIEILNRLKIRSEPMPEVKPRNTLGIGVVEAPRGTLYHEYKFSSDGTIKDARIIVPTMQNQRNIEEDIKSFVPPLLKKSRHDIEHDLEKLIRAYDPCISCAAHFLKVKWK